MSPRDLPTAAQARLLRAVAAGTFRLGDFRITTWTACCDRGWVTSLWEKRQGYQVLCDYLTAAGQFALDGCEPSDGGEVG